MREANGRLIQIVGTGMGSEGQLTGEAREAIIKAQALMGAGRLLRLVRPLNEHCPALETYRPQEMADWLEGFPWSRAVLAVSGDCGFYSGAKEAREVFLKQGWQVELLPGISSLSWFAAAVGKPWQDMAVMSCHGRKGDGAAWIDSHSLSFLLMGDLGELLGQMEARGMDRCRLWVGEKFSLEGQRIEKGNCRQLAANHREKPFGPLCCVIAENPEPRKEKCLPYLPVWGLPDSAFLRGKAPMTKAEIRAISLSKLALRPGAVCYDVGSGTGSVAVEMGLALKAAGDGAVYGVEYKKEALELTRANARNHLGDWPGFHAVEGRAPEALKDLPAPTHVFIGGSGGELEDIVRTVFEKNPKARIVVNALTPQTLAQLVELRKSMKFSRWEMVQAALTSYRDAGSYLMPSAGNPVYVVVMEGPGAHEMKEDGGQACTNG